MISKEMVLEPRGNMLTRQELIDITPQCTPKCSLICNFFLFLIFLAFGVPIVITENMKYEKKIEYTSW
jgi:hypothetical protein